MHANSFNSRVILGSANTVELPQHLKLNPDTVEILKTNFGVSVAMAGLCDNTHALESGDTPTLADTGTSNIPTQNGFEIPHNSPSAQPEDCVVPDELFYLSKTGPSDKDTSDHWSGSAPASDTPSEKVQVSSVDAMNGVQASSTPVQISKHDPMPTSLPLACPPPQILWQLGNLQAHISPQLVFPHRLPHEEITTASLDAAGVILQPAIMSNDSNANSSTPPALSPYGWAGTKLSRMHLDGNRTIGVQIDVKVRMINPNP